MCGIFGWSFSKEMKGAYTESQRLMLISMLAVWNAKRGEESWGVHLQAKDKQITDKDVGSIVCARNLHRWGAYPLGFGHTRQPTTGEVIKENAHPFTYKNLVMAHNGVIYNHEELNKKLEIPCAVDSQHLIRALAGEEQFDQIEGYGAIEWVNLTEPGRVHLCRMKSGSLAVHGIRDPYDTKSKGDRKTVGVIWSSDCDHLDEVEKLLDLWSDTYAFQVEEGKVYDIHGGMMYESDHHDIKLSKNDSRFDFGKFTRSGGRAVAATSSFYSTREYYDPYTGYQGTEFVRGPNGEIVLGKEEDPEKDKFCWYCGEKLSIGGWCSTCQDYPGTQFVSRMFLNKRITKIAEQWHLTPKGGEDWQDECGNVIKHEDLMDLVLSQSEGPDLPLVGLKMRKKGQPKAQVIDMTTRKEASK